MDVHRQLYRCTVRSGERLRHRAGLQYECRLRFLAGRGSFRPLQIGRVGWLAVLALQRNLAYRGAPEARSEEHTSELQSLMRISYAVFCLKQKRKQHRQLLRAYTQ